MELRNLGHSGLKVSVLGLGTNNFGTRIDEAKVQNVVDQALELGVNFFDTADIYGRGMSETLLGKTLGARRKDVIVATKFGLPMSDSPFERGGSRRWIMREVEASLRRLGTDYIDLYQYHEPDHNTPFEETLRTLDDLVREGKVRYVGHSNLSGWQIADAQWIASTNNLVEPISAQNHYSLIRREVEREVIPACRRFGLGLIPYFPLASGFLSGKYTREVTPSEGRLAASAGRAAILTEENYSRLDRFEHFAEANGHTVLELALGWLASQPQVSTVISSASSPEQLRTNAKAVEWKLDAASREAVAAL